MELETKKLKEYLSILLDMEKSVYFENEMIQRLKIEIESKKQTLQFEHAPVEPELPQTKPIKPDKLWVLLPMIPLVVLGIPGIAAIVRSHEMNSFGDFFLFILGVFLVICSLGAFLGGFFSLKDDAKKDRENYKKNFTAYQNALSNYPDKQKAYEGDLREYQQRIKQLSQIIQLRETQLKELQETAVRTRQRLQQFYEVKYNEEYIIYPKWRGFANIANLYDYIASGMCRRLRGEHGAYEQLMEDLRANRVISSIDEAKRELSASMDQIAWNQSAILNELRDVNDTLGRIGRDLYSTKRAIETTGQNQNIIEQELRSIQKNSMLQTYQNERIQKELQYANRMNYLVGNYNGTFFNLPPT